jgi:probable rRNA maturation factor
MIILQKRIPGLRESSLNRFLADACRASGLRGSVNVLVTNSRQLQSLNRRFRGKDKATDVLSFPAALADGLAGDIAISADIAARNASELGHSAADEIRILMLHGVLHLAGYDHERDKGEMARKEQGLRQALGLPVGLIERNASPAGVKSRSRKGAASSIARKSVRSRQR